MTHIPVGEHVPFLPYLVDLTYVRNTGAAFSIFSEHTWILAGISLVMSVLLGWCLWKGIPFQKPLGRLTVTLLLAGAVGNLIDRAFRGYVVDMFNVYGFCRIQRSGYLHCSGGLRRLCLLRAVRVQAGGTA